MYNRPSRFNSMKGYGDGLLQMNLVAGTGDHEEENQEDSELGKSLAKCGIKRCMKLSVQTVMYSLRVSVVWQCRQITKYRSRPTSLLYLSRFCWYLLCKKYIFTY